MSRVRDAETLLTPALRREIEAAFERARRRVPVSVIEDLIRRRALTPGQVEAMLRMLPALIERAVKDRLISAAERGARLEAQVLGPLGLNPRLELVNALAVAAAEEQVALLVTRVTIESRQAIRRIVSAGIEQGITIRDQARLIRHVVGLTDRQALALRRFRREIAAAGGSGASVRKAAEKYAAKLLRQRATTIARTENISALASGQDATWRQARQDGLLPPTFRREWTTVGDELVCPVCGPMHRQTRPLGEYFVTPGGRYVMHPPAHPNCRCAVVASVRSLRPRRSAA